MLDVVFNFLAEAVAFKLGRFYLWVLTLGRIKPGMADRSQPLVSLVGALGTLALLFGIAAWVN